MDERANNELRIDICIAQFELDTDKTITPAQLRGYMAHLFTNIPEFHHHSDSSYHYPLIQYKIIDKKPCVLGLQNYSDIVFKKISEIDHITVPDKKISINNLQVKKKIHMINQKSTLYQFDSSWIALNQKNYNIFKKLIKNERKYFLEKKLVGNVLSMLKGVGIRIGFRIECSILNYKSKTVFVHENFFGGFSCKFILNISLPDHIGLGKSVSKGFGVLSRLN